LRSMTDGWTRRHRAVLTTYGVAARSLPNPLTVGINWDTLPAQVMSQSTVPELPDKSEGRDDSLALVAQNPNPRSELSQRLREEALRYAHEWAEKQGDFRFAIDEEWLFVREEGDRTYHTVNRFHPYFAMAQPPLIAKLIADYSKPSDLVVDGFCGAGVTAIEAMLLGRNAYVSDISPLARLVTKVKTTTLNLSSKWTNAFAHSVHEALLQIRNGAEPKDLPVPPMHNIDHWFRPRTQLGLAAILKLIEGVSDTNKRDFLLVAFSSILRKCSTSQNFESHLRVREGKRPAEPDVFIPRVFDMVQRMNAFRERLPAVHGRARAACGDARTLSERVEPESVDLIVTSPPYGTTSKYTSIYKLSFDWLGFPRPVKSIENAKDFLGDLTVCIREMHAVLKKGAHCCLIYGTNTEFGSGQVVDAARSVGFQPVLAVGAPVIDASKSVRGDYRRGIPIEHILVLRKSA
jgi:DNA modification methylase